MAERNIDRRRTRRNTEIVEVDWCKDLSSNESPAADIAVGKDSVDKDFACKAGDKDSANKAADIVFAGKDFADMADYAADKGFDFDSYFLDAKKRHFDRKYRDSMNKKSPPEKSSNM